MIISRWYITVGFLSVQVYVSIILIFLIPVHLIPVNMEFHCREEIYKKLVVWLCGGELAWWACVPGSLGKQGRKEGRKGERKRGKGKDWEDRRKK